MISRAEPGPRPSATPAPAGPPAGDIPAKAQGPGLCPPALCGPAGPAQSGKPVAPVSATPAAWPAPPRRTSRQAPAPGLCRSARAGPASARRHTGGQPGPGLCTPLCPARPAGTYFLSKAPPRPCPHSIALATTATPPARHIPAKAPAPDPLPPRSPGTPPAATIPAKAPAAAAARLVCSGKQRSAGRGQGSAPSTARRVTCKLLTTGNLQNGIRQGAGRVSVSLK
nr:basic proline-rich protein-like [Chelonoidis abingdonii]